MSAHLGTAGPSSARSALRLLGGALFCAIVAIAAAPTARAQADEAGEPPPPEAAEPTAEPAVEGAPGDDAGSDAEDASAGDTGDAAEGAAGDAGGAGASGAAPGDGAAGAGAVDDDPEAALRREQAAMESEGAEGGVAPEEDEEEGESLDHGYQLGIRLGAGVPFVFALRYGDDGARCAAPDSMGRERTFCVFVGSGILDGELTFGVTPDIEIAAMARVGMVPVQPTNDRQILVGLGIRSYLSPESLFKLFLGVKAILDLTNDNGLENWGSVDFGVRGEAGVQLDIVRYVGLYLQVAVNVTFLRAFAISPDATGGVQIRFP